MNYIQQINYFWSKHEDHLFGATEIALYFHLLDICNKCSWTNPFKRRNTKILADLGISWPTLKRSRNKLLQAGLINFKSKGKGDENIQYIIEPAEENRQENRKNIDSSVYSGVYSPVYSNVEHNINSKPKTKNFEDDAGYARSAKIEIAIRDYAGPKHMEVEKEKKVAPKKEKEPIPTPPLARKPLPTYQEALRQEKLIESAMWRNVLEHHGVTVELRIEKFKIFYEQNEDCYLITMPTWTEMAKHFYNWLPIHLNKAKLNQLINISNGKFNTKPSGANGNRIAANAELDDLVGRSSEFLQRTAGENYYGDIRE